MVTIIWIGIILLAAILTYKIIGKIRDKLETRTVIKFSLNRSRPKKAKPDKQACSFCKKKSIGLSFYAAEDGRVVGVCRDCKPHAERRALLRL